MHNVALQLAFEFHPSVWGTIGQWVSAIGTTSAFFATFYVIRRDAKERRRSQAQKTSLYVIARERAPEEIQGKHKTWYDLTVKNLSEEPIYDVYFMMTEGKHLIDSIGHKEIILPGETFEKRNHYSNVASGGVDVIFRDNSGHNWRRNVKGVLVERGRTEILSDRRFPDGVLNAARRLNYYGKRREEEDVDHNGHQGVAHVRIPPAEDADS
jgi:hypothetical protein